MYGESSYSLCNGVPDDGLRVAEASVAERWRPDQNHSQSIDGESRLVVVPWVGKSDVGSPHGVRACHDVFCDAKEQAGIRFAEPERQEQKVYEQPVRRYSEAVVENNHARVAAEAEGMFGAVAGWAVEDRILVAALLWWYWTRRISATKRQ
jgi:hypothetical protein